MDAASSPGPTGSTRDTVKIRPYVEPELWPDGGAVGYLPHDPYVRRFWTAVLGPGAVADLLRLIVAARTHKRLRRPKYLGDLAREGLVLVFGDHLWVRSRIPALQTRHIRKLNPTLRRELARLHRQGSA